MTPQKNQFRFPRLRAALAVAGVFALTPTQASEELPYCETTVEAFGAYSIQTRLNKNRDGSDFLVEVDLYRAMPSDSDAYLLRSSYLNQQEAMEDAFLSMDFSFSPDDLEQISLREDATRLTYPSYRHGGFESILEDVEIQIGDSTFIPLELTGTFREPFTQRNFDGQDLSSKMIEQWSSGGTVSIQYIDSRDDRQIVIGTVELGPDAIDQFPIAKQSQAKFLIHHLNEGTCVLTKPDPADDYCFLTTATVHCIGLEDDCWELETLRGFRDNILMHNPEGRALVAEYYDIAPAIVEAVNRRADSEWQWLKTYWTGILPTALMAKAGLNALAQRTYHRMVRNLEGMVA